MKKFLSIIFCVFLTCLTANADFADHYNAAQQYLAQYQYSSAISEFKKALRINYLDDSARIGLVNSYLARGTYFANKDRNWEGAANDYRAALFYLKYYPASSQDVQNSAQAIANTTENLNQCLTMQKFDTSAKSRYAKAKDLRLQGFFPEAGYEFAQTLSDPGFKKNSYEQIADMLNVLGNDQKCSEYLQKAIALDSNNAGLRLKHARVLDRLGQNEAAAIEYNYALTNGSNDPEILYALERNYRQKLAQSPNDSPTLTNLGAILQKENKYDEALQYYTQASQLDPTNVTTRLNIGTLYQQKGSYDSAIGAYDSILFLNSNNLEANLYKSQCLAAMGQNDKALEGFKKVLCLDSTNKVAKNQIFDILKTTKTPAEMMAYMSQTSPADKSKIDDMYDYAIELHKQNKFDDAIAYYKEILKVKSNNPEVYLNLAIAYKQKNDLVQAKRILQDAKAKFPSNKQISDSLVALMQEAIAGKFDEASQAYNSGEYQKALSAYLAIQPSTFDSLCGIAASYKGLNNDTTAIEYYKKALALKSDSDIAYYIGVLYSEKEEWMNSKTYLKKALLINPNNSKAKDLLGTVIEQANVKLVDNAIAFYDKGNYAESLKIINQVLAEEPKNAYALYYRGLIYDVQKKYALAIVDYKKAVQNNSSLTIVSYLMALDYDNLAQYKNALTNYNKYVSATTENNEYKKYAQARAKELKKYE